MSSLIHTSNLVTVANNLKTVLGNHLVLRNVLLSSSIDSRTKYSNAYTWTTSYCTLMSAGQLTGTFKQNSKYYDDGEANYKLPLFDYERYKISGYNYWLRGIYGYTNSDLFAWNVGSDGNIDKLYVINSGHMRPLIYLR